MFYKKKEKTYNNLNLELSLQNMTIFLNDCTYLLLKLQKKNILTITE